MSRDAAAASPADPAAPDPAEPAADPAARPADPAAHGSRGAGLGVALLLAAAAVLAALITARATMVGGEAIDAWQRSVGQEQKRGALLLESAGFAYEQVGDMAFIVATEQVRGEELRAAAEGADEGVAARLTSEAQVHERVAESIRTASVIGTDPQYALPSGGYDLQRSLADDRERLGEDLAIDPVATVAAGDAASARSLRLLATTTVVGVGFLLGSLAQAAPTHRRMLLVLGWATVLGAGALALVVAVAS